jgi:hypothetical protein
MKSLNHQYHSKGKFLKDLDLPSNEHELSVFVMSGRLWFGTIVEPLCYEDYSLTIHHIARNIRVIESAEMQGPDTLFIKMRGTGEDMLVNRYNQSEAPLFKAIVRSNQFGVL